VSLAVHGLNLTLLRSSTPYAPCLVDRTWSEILFRTANRHVQPSAASLPHIYELLPPPTMSAFSPRRSARLAQDQAQSLSSQSTPSFTLSHSTSTSTSSHPSPTNHLLNPPPPPPTPQQANSRNQAYNTFAMSQQSHFNAPLPSPSASDMPPFFGRSSSQPSFQSQGSIESASSYEQQAYQQNQEQPQQLHPHTNSVSQGRHAINSMSPQMPADFLAEAAKRAQIACLMRDMGDVSL
jgi:hypothetical protein